MLSFFCSLLREDRLYVGFQLQNYRIVRNLGSAINVPILTQNHNGRQLEMLYTKTIGL